MNRSREGIHVKDWLTSPEVDNNGFETVEIRGPVDLRQLTIGVNFYDGDPIAAGVDGTIRIEAGGRVYQSPFHLRASRGNGGGDSAGRLHSPFWTVLDPMVITKQR